MELQWSRPTWFFLSLLSTTITLEAKQTGKVPRKDTIVCISRELIYSSCLLILAYKWRGPEANNAFWLMLIWIPTMDNNRKRDPLQWVKLQCGRNLLQTFPSKFLNTVFLEYHQFIFLLQALRLLGSHFELRLCPKSQSQMCLESIPLELQRSATTVQSQIHSLWLASNVCVLWSGVEAAGDYSIVKNHCQTGNGPALNQGPWTEHSREHGGQREGLQHSGQIPESRHLLWQFLSLSFLLLSPFMLLGLALKFRPPCEVWTAEP